jgi:hypothetical protein
MNRIRPVVIGSALLATTAIAGVLTASSRADAQNPHPGTAPVSIVNPLPLPVTGSVGLTPGSAVTIDNPLPIPVTGRVDLIPGGTVTIDNSATSPVLVRDVDEAAKEPFQESVQDLIYPNTQLGAAVGLESLGTVPAGKRLVIEHVSAHIVVGTSQLRLVRLSTSGMLDALGCHLDGSNNATYFFSCSSQTKFYVEAGQELFFVVTTADMPAATASDSRFWALVSGHYVPVP